jgi:purine-binding chemotaxis protein CheW
MQRLDESDLSRLPEARPRRTPSLIVAVGPCVCAIPVAHVVETMRPLPIAPLAKAAAFVLGVSVIRGAPVPVVDLHAVAGVAPSARIGRFVSLTLGDRRVALAVSHVIGVRELDATNVAQMPPLLRAAPEDVVEAIGMLDAQLLLVLRAGRLLPDDDRPSIAEPSS